MTDYQPVIGLEVHIQLQTHRKVFAPESFEFGAPPNQYLSPVTLAHPGALPVPNLKCISHAVKLGLALGCEISRQTRFARKNYFYPDSPKGYQLSQDENPVCVGGEVDLVVAEKRKKTIRLERIHLEEDAGKSIHDLDPAHSMIDLNRAGTGLLEMVTQPDFRTVEEVMVFLTKIRRLVRYLEVSDGDMEKGNLRCDANVSVMPVGSDTYGTRVEIKNLNSIQFTRKAIEFEVERQVDILQEGGSIQQQTRTFQVATGKTLPMRDKETADDYRYFPEPDMLDVHISEAEIEKIRKGLPELPEARLSRYTIDLGILEKKAIPLVETKALSDYFEKLLKTQTGPDTAANWLLGPVKAHLNESGIEIADFPVSPESLSQLIHLVIDKKVNLQVAKSDLFQLLLNAPGSDPLALATQHNLIMESNEDQVGDLMGTLMERHPEEVKKFKAGKKQLMGFFVGQIMRELKGKADPKEVNRIVAEKLRE